MIELGHLTNLSKYVHMTVDTVEFRYPLLTRTKQKKDVSQY